MHGLFTGLLKRYEINRLYLAPLKEHFLLICGALADSGKEDRVTIERNLHALNTKFETLEERFAFGEIDRDIFEKVGGRLKEEIKSVNDELKGSGIELSNPSLLVDHSLEIIGNLSDFWVSGDYDNKRKLQELLFPGGILFDKQSNDYRTLQVNSVLQLTHSISNDLAGNKNGQIKKISNLPGLVAPAGRMSNRIF
jgi:site-specific DNA recombinase